MLDKLWTVPLGAELAADLESDLRIAEEAARAKRATRYPDRVELLLDRYKGLTITVRANEHPPPHFHVECAGGEASFRISDGALLAGNLGKEARVVRRWYVRNKAAVIGAWNQLRPSDCPVGPYAE